MLWTNVDLNTLQGHILALALESLEVSRRRWVAGRSVRRYRRQLVLRCDRAQVRRRERAAGVAAAAAALREAVALAVEAFSRRRSAYE